MMPDAMTAALVAARVAQFAAVAVLFGAGLFRLVAAGCFRTSSEASQGLDAWLRPLFLYAALLALASCLAWLSVEAALMSESWAGAVSGEVLSTVLLQTQFGHVWTARLGLAGAVLVLAAVSFRRRGRKAGATAITVLSALLVVSLAGTGHAVMATGAARDLDVANLAVHLLAASAWLGGLLPLSFLLRKVKSESDPAWLAAAQAALSRFSQLGLVAVSALVLTGVVTSWSLLDSVAALVATEYGRVLLAKLALVLAMIGLAAANRFRLMPRLALAGQAGPARRLNPIAQLSRNVALEQALGLFVLVAVSLLGTLPPDHATASINESQGMSAPTIAAALRPEALQPAERTKV